MTGLRLTAVAGFDQLTAVALLKYSDPSVVLFGTLLLIVVILPASVPIVVFSFWTLRWMRFGRRPEGVELIFVAISYIGGIMVVPWQALVLFTLAGLMMAVEVAFFETRLIEAHKYQGPFLLFRQAMRYTLILMGGFVSIWWFLAALFTPTPWMPSERITLSNGTSFTGYVVNNDEKELVVLRAEHRHLDRLSMESIDSRELCRREKDIKVMGFVLDPRPLGTILLNGGTLPKYVHCPTS